MRDIGTSTNLNIFFVYLEFLDQLPKETLHWMHIASLVALDPEASDRSIRCRTFASKEELFSEALLETQLQRQLPNRYQHLTVT